VSVNEVLLEGSQAPSLTSPMAALMPEQRGCERVLLTGLGKGMCLGEI